jgi:DNA repair exonuclease SbcCD nuclease subunit
MLILGDVFDRNKPNPDELALFFDLLNMLEKNKIRTFITNGNHEATTKVKSFLDPFESLKYKYITFVSKSAITYSPRPGTNWVFWPYSYIKNQVDVRDIKLDGENYLFTHARGSAESFHVTEEYPFGWFTESCFRTVFLGDIHLGHWIQPNVVYPGAPVEIKYGSKVSNSVIVHDFDDDSTQFIPLDSIPLNVVRLDISEVSREGILSLELTGHTKFVISGSREELDAHAQEIEDIFTELKEATDYYILCNCIPNKLSVDMDARFVFTRPSEKEEQPVEVLSVDELDLYLDYLQTSEGDKAELISEYLHILPTI